MCAGVLKSGSPRLKSKTVLPSAFSWRALAPAASVADGCTAAAIREIGSCIAAGPQVRVAPGAGLVLGRRTLYLKGSGRGRETQGGDRRHARGPFRAALPAGAG